MAPAKTSRIALVTGAARRIGRAIALDLARHGWDVAVHHNRSAGEARAVVAEIEALGARAIALEADLLDREAVSRLVPRCANGLGAPSCLVNNASQFLDDEIATLTPERWQTHMSVNLEAPVFLARSLAEHLGEGDGVVVNIIDENVWRPTPRFLSYSISKAGLWAATRMLAQALAPRIRVNAIGPGPVLASIYQSEEEFRAQWDSMPLGRGTTPEEIAAAVRFILDAPAMTGQMIALDGGQHLIWEASPGSAGGGRAPNGRREAPQQVPREPAFGIRHVLVRDLEISTIIGVHDYEKRAPQRILVNVDIAVPEKGPFVSDRLEEVIDYGEVVRGIERICSTGHVNLVETLAERVAQHCLADARVASARVRIEKPDVIANAAGVGIEIVRTRDPR